MGWAAASDVSRERALGLLREKMALAMSTTVGSPEIAALKCEVAEGHRRLGDVRREVERLSGRVKEQSMVWTVCMWVE